MSLRARASPILRRLVGSGGAVYTEVALLCAPLQLQLQCQAELLRLLSTAGPSLGPWNLSFAARALSTGGAAGGGRQAKAGRDAQRAKAVVTAEEEFSAITDKIPQRPVSVVEGTSYTLVIVAALGFAAAVVYAAVSELLLQPKEYACYNQTLERIKDDPRITVRLGTPLSSYGTESRNRAARQRIPHRLYSDDQGREHIQLQFQLKGPSGRATVNADMYQEGGAWQYKFLYLDVESPIPQQLVLIAPGQVAAY